MKTAGPRVLGINGFKKSGKTSLIEYLLGVLGREGIKLGVIKHQNEPGRTDQPGTDTYRFYEAGADVVSYDGKCLFVKRHQTGPLTLTEALAQLGGHYDLILVEGFKESAAAKLWLLRPEETEPPAHIRNIIAVLEWTKQAHERQEKTLQMLRAWLTQ